MTYDYTVGAWRSASYPVTAPGSVVYFKVFDGVVAWVVPNGASAYVMSAIYDPSRGAWMTDVTSYSGLTDVTVNGLSSVATVSGSSQVRGYNANTAQWSSNPTTPFVYFALAPTSGNPPLTVWMWDMSIAPSGWTWTVNDGRGSTSTLSGYANWSYTFTSRGFGTVSLSTLFPDNTTHTKSATVNVGNVTAPTILTQPPEALGTSNYTANAGGSVTLSVAASGSAPLTFQWRKDGLAIAGATSSVHFFSELPLTNLQPADSGSYTVVVSDASGSVTSDAVKITVNGAAPTITWSTPSAITYGTTLGSAQLNATASVPGTFAYSPSSGALLNAGSQLLTVTFTPTDTVNYRSVTANVSLTVNKATPVLTWANPASITYGTALGGAQLNASANVAGTFNYSPSNGAVLNAGSQSLSATFTPTDSINYNSATAAVTLTVNKATPSINWSNPADVAYGTALSGTQLSAIANVQGSFVYSPSTGAVLGVGDHQALSTTFTPSDSANYTSASATVYLNVKKAVVTISWPVPAAITYGAALGNAQLNASANVAGTFNYSPSSGTALSVGNNQTLSVAFVPDDTVNYNNASASVTINVLKATPNISWPTPAAITYGTALGGAQLNATANVQGSFVYSPSTGAILSAGNQTLTVSFTPNDTANYKSTTATVNLTVEKATPSINWATPASIGYGTALSSAQLNATASVNGTFVYSPSNGAVLDAGSHMLSVTFQPADAANYNSSVGNVTLIVAKITPVINWPTPSPITYGTQLSSAQLNGTANVPGSFSYSPSVGTILDAGVRTLLAHFTPNDTLNYNAASAQVNVTVNKADQTITMEALSERLLSAGAFTVSATASSGLPVSFTIVSGPATISGNAVTLMGAGTVTIRASQGGDSNYNAAANVDQSFQVNKANQTITFQAPGDRTFGDPPFALSATASSGLPVNFNIVSGQRTLSDNILTITGAGGLTVRASQPGNDNFNPATSVDQTFNINKAAAVITLSGLQQTYDGTPKSVTPTSSPARLNVLVTYDGATNPPVNPGNYAVLAAINEANYIGSTNGTLVISPSTTGLAMDGYISHGTVFFDANANGVLDDNEPRTQTDDKGNFNLSIDPQKVDTNKIGRLVVIGGVDIATGVALQTPMLAPAGAKVVSPLTTLVVHLQAEGGLSQGAAEQKVKDAFGISTGVALLSFDPIKAAGQFDPNAVPVINAAAKVQDTITQVAALLGGADIKQKEQAGAAASAAMANTLVAEASLNLSESNTVKTVIKKTAVTLNQVLDVQTTGAAAQLISQVNQIKDQGIQAGDARLALEEITKVQVVAQSELAPALEKAGQSTNSIAALVGENSSEALQHKVQSAQVGDLGAGWVRARIARDDAGQVVISWPATADPGYVLEVSETLGPTGQWTAVGGVQLEGQSRKATLNAGKPRAFYRLRKP